MNFENFHRNALVFLDKLFINLESKKIHLNSSWDIDHLCFRSSSHSEYENLKGAFLKFANLLIESPVNGRPIATFKLQQPIYFKDWSIDLVELPAPKMGKPTNTGFEHIEVVCDENLVTLIHRFPPQWVHTAGLTKSFNPELELILGDENLKFHNLSLESVINIEKNRRVFSALTETALLLKLKNHNPLVVGTFPLGIETDTSDIDICLTYDNESDLLNLLTKEFSHFDDFNISECCLFSGKALQTNFKHAETSLKFELIAQNTPSEKQVAYQHFQIEEKILKYSGRAFRELLIAERANGLKTEPAFAKVLSLSGDPYAELLKLNKLSLVELRKFLLAKNISL